MDFLGAGMAVVESTKEIEEKERMLVWMPIDADADAGRGNGTIALKVALVGLVGPRVMDASWWQKTLGCLAEMQGRGCMNVIDF